MKEGRRAFFRNLVPVLAGGIVGAVAGHREPLPDVVNQIDALQKDNLDIRDRLLLTNQRLGQVGAIVVFHDKQIKTIQEEVTHK